MEMLIIEDTLRHQMAAQAQFPEAQVVNYDEAYKILRIARPGDFSAILTDLHFRIERGRRIPAAPFSGSYEKNVAAIGTEMPFGLAFVLKAVELRTPCILYSDMDHHSDLVTGLLDMFGSVRAFSEDGISSFYPSSADRVPDSRFFIFTDGDCVMAKDMYWDGVKIVSEPLPSTAVTGQTKHCEQVKDWRRAHHLLTMLMQNKSTSA